MISNVRRGLAFVATAGLLAVGACSGGDTPGGKASVPGVTDTEVLVGTHQPLTGPASGGYSKIAPATKAYFDYVNANGGVNGRTIKYKIVDDGYNPAKTQTVVRELVQQDKVFAILNGLGTPTHTGVLDFLKTNKVPDLFVASGSRSWSQVDKYPGTFAFQPDYTTEGKVLGTYIKTTWPGKKVCHLGQADDFGADSLAGIEKGLGAPVAAKQTYVTSNQNVAPQIGALKAAGCEVVALATVPGFTALALGTAARIGGFKPQWVSSGVGGDYTTLAGYLKEAAPVLLEGFVAPGYLPSVANAADPWNVLFKKINDQYGGAAVYDGNVIYGMSVGYLFVQALQKAGRDLTREGIIAAVESGGFSGPGIVPFAYSRTSHAGYSGVRLGSVKAGVQDYFGPVYQTDAADAPVTEYTGQPAAPPANGIPAP